MSEAEQKEVSKSRRPRPRFSLQTLLLLTTIVALGVIVWRQAGEVVPLRQELRQLRGEMGHLTIDDPNKAYAIAVQTSESDTWKWRIYLPPGGTHSFSSYYGTIPSQTEFRGRKWFQEVKNGGSGSSGSGSGYEGEFTLTVRLFKKEDQWFISQRSSNGRINGSNSLALRFDDWLSDPRSRMTTSNVSNEQSSYQPGEPIMLLHLPKPIITESAGGGWSKKLPEGPHDGIVIWIE